MRKLTHLLFSHVQVWDLVENKHLFDGRDEEGEHNNRFHISEMVAYLGVPPIEFQKRSEHAHKVFNEDGTSRSFSWKSPLQI
jgi:serine/threonine-protein kinase SRPK3